MDLQFAQFTETAAGSNSISDIGIRKLYVDQYGNLWVITLSGKLDRFDPVSEFFIHYNFENDDTFETPVQ